MSKKTAAQPPNHIIISHVYSSENKGDAALTSVLIQDLKRTFKGARITILTLDSLTPGSFEGIPQKPSFMAYVLNAHQNPLAKLAYALYMMSATLLWAAWRRVLGGQLYLPKHLRDITKLYDQADLVVPVGGGYIRSRRGLVHCFNVPLLLHPLLLGYVLGKPTVLYSQSVGPFHNNVERALVAFVLKRMTCILIREDVSVAVLAKLGVVRNVVRGVDSGFLLQSKHKVDLRRLYKIPKNGLLVGVTVRSWLEGDTQDAYETAVAKALDELIETTNAHVVFIPQVTAAKGDDDRVVSQRVYQRMRRQNAATVITDRPDHHTIKALYDNLAVLLGTRFHSVIFSLTSYVPVVAIEYEHKTSGIMHDLGLDQWVIKIEDVTAPKLGAHLQKLIREQANYKAYLNLRIPPYVQKAKQTVQLLKRFYATTE